MVAECFEASDVAAFLGGGRDVAVVVVGAEVFNRVSGSASRCQVITRIERPVATMAFFFPRLRAIRR